MIPGHESAMGPGALPRGPRGAGRHHVAEVPDAEDLVPRNPRHPQGPGRRDASSAEPGECQVPDHPRRPRGDDRATWLAVRLEVRLVAGDAGQALAAAQGRALTALLASLGDVEVEGGKEASP